MKVTIGIPTFNGGRYVDEAVLGALRLGVDVVVVDDASTDETVSQLERLRADYRFELLRNSRNQGIAVTYQLLLDRCRTELLLILNQDDVIFPHARSMLHRVNARPGKEAVYVMNAWILDEYGRRCRLLYRRPPFDALLRGPAAALRVVNFIKSPSQVILPVDRARRVGGFLFDGAVGQGAEDWLLWYRLAHAQVPFVLYGRPSVGYRIHDSNASHSPNLQLSTSAVSEHIRRSPLVARGPRMKLRL